MVEFLILISFAVAFLVTLLFTPVWIKRAKSAGLEGKDMNKTSGKKVAEAGGIAVIGGFILGLLFYIAIRTFYFKTYENSTEILALLSTILLVSFVGFIDDIFGWKIGLNKKTRIILVIFAAVPLMVINAGESQIFIPFFGSTNIGVIYPLILIPLGITGAAVTFNFLAGYNGLEAGQGVIILSTLTIASFITGTTWLSVVGLIMVASLMSFLLFNSYPSKVFPGDVLTYSVGALIAIMAILGNYEQFALFIFIPYIIETGLKLRGGLKKESFAKPNEDGSIDLKYNKIYGLEHLAIYILKKVKKSQKVYENEVVYLLYGFQLIFCISSILIFFRGYF